MKYIIIRVVAQAGFVYELPVIFPNALTHSVIADAIQQSEDLKGKNSKVVAAGEVSSTYMVGGSSREGPCCHGKSVSLGGIESRGVEDDAVIYMHDYHHGIR